MEKTKSFRTTKTGINLNSTLIDTTNYYDPTPKGLKQTKELISSIINSRVEDTDHYKTAIDLIIKRQDLTTLKVKTITILLQKYHLLYHIFPKEERYNIYSYLFDMYDTHSTSDTRLTSPTALNYFYIKIYKFYITTLYNAETTPPPDHKFINKFYDKLTAYKLFTPAHYIHLFKAAKSPSQLAERQAFVSAIHAHDQTKFQCTSSIIDAIITTHRSLSKSDYNKLLELLIFKFAPPLTPELIQVYTKYAHYNYYYHSQSQLTASTKTNKTYLETYPLFYELMYLSRKRITEIRAQKQLFDKYKKKGGTHTLSDTHFQALLSGKTLNVKFIESVFRYFKCEFNFPMFIAYINSQLSSDRKRRTVTYLSTKITNFPQPQTPSSPTASTVSTSTT